MPISNPYSKTPNMGNGKVANPYRSTNKRNTVKKQNEKIVNERNRLPCQSIPHNPFKSSHNPTIGRPPLQDHNGKPSSFRLDKAKLYSDQRATFSANQRGTLHNDIFPNCSERGLAQNTYSPSEESNSHSLSTKYRYVQPNKHNT